MRNKNLVVLASIGILVIGLIVFLPSANSYETLDSFEGEMKLYKSSSCGCCGVYSNYFASKGNKDLEVVEMYDISSVKDSYEIPSFLESCHTIIVGEYFVEGHVPLEAIEKLLSEKPNISGIGMPGMPSGSPGMPGSKKGDFVIQGINHDGSSFEFMRI